MKKIVLLITLSASLFLTVSCGNTGQINKKSYNVFQPVLENEILYFIKKNNNIDSKEKICSVYLTKDARYNDNCVIILLFVYGIRPEIITGYTFLDKNLVVFYSLTNECDYAFINETELIQFKDSIYGYPNILNDYSDLNYATPMSIYKIENNDSILLVEKNW
jgi:hypothetical protein